MSSNLTPLDVCERLVAPIGELGEIFGGNTKYGYHFRRGSSWRDAGDLTARVQRNVLEHAKANGIPIKPEYLILGATEAEIASLLDQRPEAAE